MVLKKSTHTQNSLLCHGDRLLCRKPEDLNISMTVDLVNHQLSSRSLLLS